MPLEIDDESFLRDHDFAVTLEHGGLDFETVKTALLNRDEVLKLIAWLQSWAATQEDR